MKKFLTISASSALLSGLLLITSCSSSDDSSGGSVSGGTATVPANAILIDTSLKAETTTTSAIQIGDAIVSLVGVETSTPVTATDVLNNIKDKFLNDRQSASSAVTGVVINDPCFVSGSVTGEETETSTTYNATVNYNACDDGAGFILTGTVSISATFTATLDGPYTAIISGDLTAVTSTVTIGFNQLSFAQSGNDGTGAFTVTTFTFAIDPSTGGGYAVQLTQPLVGNEFVSCQLTSGQILITGAAGSQARATVNPDGSAKIEYHSGDGNFIETNNSPLACLI